MRPTKCTTFREQNCHVMKALTSFDRKIKIKRFIIRHTANNGFFSQTPEDKTNFIPQPEKKEKNQVESL